MSGPDEASAPDLPEAVRRRYGDGGPDFGWQTALRWDEGGPDPLDQVLVYARHDPVPHWHYVGVGLSSDAAGGDDGRGWDFELTARLSRADGDAHTHPPVFMVNVLQNLARYVARSGNAFGPGHTIDLNGPIQLGSTTPVRHVLFVEDPELDDGDGPATAGADGEPLRYLQVVGLTDDEVVAKKTWTAEGFAGLYAAHHPLLVTRLDRSSVLVDPAVREALERGRARDGSSTSWLALDRLDVREEGSPLGRLRRRPPRTTVTIGAQTVEPFRLLLPLRLSFGQTLRLVGPDVTVTFTPDAVPAHRHADGEHVVSLTPDQARAVATQLAPRAGRYAVPGVPHLVLEVEQTLVCDDDGAVVRVIG